MWYALMCLQLFLLPVSTARLSRVQQARAYLARDECLKQEGLDEASYHEFVRHRQEAETDRRFKCLIKCYLVSMQIMVDGAFDGEFILQRVMDQGFVVQTEVEKCNGRVDRTEVDLCERAYRWLVCIRAVEANIMWPEYSNSNSIA